LAWLHSLSPTVIIYNVVINLTPVNIHLSMCLEFYIFFIYPKRPLLERYRGEKVKEGGKGGRLS